MRLCGGGGGGMVGDGLRIDVGSMLRGAVKIVEVRREVLWDWREPGCGLVYVLLVYDFFGVMVLMVFVGVISFTCFSVLNYGIIQVGISCVWRPSAFLF